MAAIVGPIFALDLGAKTGFAVGSPSDDIPHSGTVTLRYRKDDDRRVVVGNLLKFLMRRWGANVPSLVVMVKPPTIQWHASAHSQEKTARMQYALPGIVEGMCEWYGIPLGEVHEDTVRKHFIGIGRTGNREATKRTVLSRCITLGYLDRGCEDDDRGDACALWDWARSTYGRRAGALALYGQENANPT